MQNEFEGKSNYDLRYIIEYTDKKDAAAEQLLKQEPTNEDLRYIIEYTDKKDAAWEQLLKQEPTNYDLRYIIRYTDKKDAAWEQLLKQEPTNEDLRYIIRYTDKKDAAAELLRKKLRISEVIDEKALIKEIAVNVLSRPGSLDMGKWHCGTTHCLAGWACVINPVAAGIEKRFDTETAGDAVLPNYSHLFFSDNETVLRVLEEVVGQ